MYHYDEYDRALVQDRVKQFRRQVERRLAGEISEDQFYRITIGETRV